MRLTADIHGSLRQTARETPLPVIVDGSCMRPWMDTGARVFVQHRRFYWPGDVIVFRTRDGRYLVHRVIGLYRKHGRLKYLTQADSAIRPDPAIDEESILGRVSGGPCNSQPMSVSTLRRLHAVTRFCRFAMVHMLKGARPVAE